MENLNSLFSPKSIAVVGASRREGTLGKMFLDAVQKMNYQGEIYPINPKADSVNGVKCYPEIQSLPLIPDLAIILLPKDIVIKAVEQIALKGIINIIVISAGFKETGREGEERERELVELVKKHGMRMIGPNSMGLFNTDPAVLLNATFSPTLPIPGHVGFISQSGALGVAVLELSKSIDLRFSCFVSTGNKADVSDVDCLKYLAEDNNTNTIILYQESLDQPGEFRKICTEIVKKKPVLTLKAGRTSSGLKAASSHTGALASDDVITGAFLMQCGIIRCDSLDELLETALVFESQKMLSGNRVAVVTNAGGPGILATDALVKNGLYLAEFSEDTIRNLKAILPGEASLHNPVDMIASANHKIYRDVCSLVAEDSNVDSVMVIIVKPPIMTTPKMIVEELQPILIRTTKPFICALMAAKDEEAGIELFKKLKIPLYSSPESAARSLGNLYRYARIRKRFTEYTLNFKRDIKQPEIQGGNQRQAGLDEIFKLLSGYNLKICKNVITGEREKAIRFQEDKDVVVLKIANESIIHKSDLDLVKTGLSSALEIGEAFDMITEKARTFLPDGIRPIILVQEMLSSGLEFILGAKHDPQFGKLIMFGLGGIFVELYKDIVFRILPLDKVDAHQMIEGLQGREILDGFRHFPAIDHDILADTIVRFSEMVYEHPEIIEMDLNPLIWSEKDKELIVVDSRCTLVV